MARLLGQMEWRFAQAGERLGYLQKALQQQHPTRQFEQLRLRLQHASERLLQRLRYRLGEDRHRLQLCQAGLAQSNPQYEILRRREHLGRLLTTQQAAMRQKLLLSRHRLSLQARSLDTLSPLKTLARGFATVSKDEHLVTSVEQLKSGDDIDIRLSDGSTEATVK